MAADSRDTLFTALGWLVYGAAVLALTYPVIRDPSTALISQWPTDADHFLWLQWWFARAVESAELSIFQTDLLRFPDTTDLRLADLNLFVNALFYALAKPFGWVGAYNAMLWGSFLASAGLMWRLGTQLSGDRVAGWLSGLVFAASSYWIATALNSWAYLVHIWVFPLALLAIRRAAVRGRLADFVALGVVLGLIFHVSPYYFLFLGVLLVALAPWAFRELVAVARAPGGAMGLAAVALIAGCIVAPRAWPMVQANLADFAVHSGPASSGMAARWIEFVAPNVDRPDRLANGTFLIAFLGYTVPIGIACGFWISPRRRAYVRWWVAAGVALVLALGPRVEFADGGMWRLPGHWLLSRPGFDFMTNHWRWTLLAHFCLAAAFSLAIADLRQRLPGRRQVIATGAAVLFSAEVAFVFPFPREKPLWRRPPDAISVALRDDPSIGAILDLRPRTKIRQLVHEKRIVGGWLPRVDRGSVERTQRLMEEIRAAGDASAPLLHERGIDAIIVDERTAYRVVASRQGSFELRPLRAN